MEAATLRLILVVVGAAFLLGLYLWERRRAEDGNDEHDWDKEPGAEREPGPKREPRLGTLGSDPPYDSPPTSDDPAPDALGPRPDLHRQAQQAGAAPGRGPETPADTRSATGLEPEDEYAPESEPEEQPGAEAEADADSPIATGAFPAGASRPPTRPGDGGPVDSKRDQRKPGDRADTDDANGGPATLLIQLFVVAAGKPFAGERILAAAQRLKLAPGSMDIFHRQASDDSARPPLYSMANLVKPGTFPLHDMHAFETPGLALFAQLEGDPSDLMVYDELLHTARALADELGGEVQERGRKPLTEERARALRGEVSALLQLGSGHAADPE